jgi:imidazole glycerol phosphate synthase subunit HisF
VVKSRADSVSVVKSCADSVSVGTVFHRLGNPTDPVSAVFGTQIVVVRDWGIDGLGEARIEPL